jgi:rare lipoprotein A
VLLKPLTKVIIILFMISLVGFTIVNNEESTAKIPVISDAFENVNEGVNTDLIDYVDKGVMVVSWYGPRFHGRKTANGEIFDQSAYTAAHKNLGFGTLLRITNPKNSKSVIVRINDRGPYIRGRHLDISKAAATDLEILQKGVAKLQIEQISLKGINFPVITLN